MPRGGKLNRWIPMEHVQPDLEAGGLEWQCINPRWAAWPIFLYRKLTRTGPPVRLDWC